MSIDGRVLGIVRIDPKSSILTLTETQVRALLPALLKDGHIAWTSKGMTWTVSTAGANAVLLKMDEFEGRLDTPGALVRKGSKLESNVLPPLPAPEVQAGPVSQDKNTGDGYWVVDAKPPYLPALVTTSSTDYDDGVITSFQKGRGIADCVATATWTWDGRTFAPTSDTTTGMCRQIMPGAWDLPTLVTHVRKSR
jgi:hypothetical protein